MMMLLHARNNFRCVECAHIGLSGLRQAKDAARILFGELRQHIRLAAQIANLYPRPFAPQIDAGRSFNEVRDKCSANASRNLEEVETAVLIGADIFAMSDATRHAQVGSKPRVERSQFLPFAALAVHGAGGEYT